MKILFLVSSMGGGGAERVAAMLANAWAVRGDEVILMPTFSGRGECVYSLSERVRLEYLADCPGVRGGGGRSYLRRFIALRWTIKKYSPDVVISFLTNVNVAAVLASWGLPCRVIVSERTHPPSWPISPALKWLRRKTYPRAWAVVALTQESCHWLEKYCPGARVRIIPNPVDWPLEKRTPQSAPSAWISEERHLLLAAGRLIPEKGFKLLLQAFGRLAIDHPNWDLAIVGEGPEREAIEYVIKELGLDNRLYLPGRVGNIADWYHRADLYVMTSLVEGFPNTLTEAMAHGVPAVSFDCDTGPRDIIRHGIDGLLVSPGDTGALTRELGRLMGDDELRGRLALHAPEVRERFSLQRILSLWDEVMNAPAS